MRKPPSADTGASPRRASCGSVPAPCRFGMTPSTPYSSTGSRLRVRTSTWSVASRSVPLGIRTRPSIVRSPAASHSPRRSIAAGGAIALRSVGPGPNPAASPSESGFSGEVLSGGTAEVEEPISGAAPRSPPPARRVRPRAAARRARARAPKRRRGCFMGRRPECASDPLDRQRSFSQAMIRRSAGAGSTAGAVSWGTFVVESCALHSPRCREPR